MTKTTARERASAHVCTSCGHTSPRWFGRCAGCGSWSSAVVPAGIDEAAVQITTLAATTTTTARLSTGIADVDLVLGGGIVPGAVVLLAGEPGIGKSTLVLQLLDGLTRGGHSCLLVSGEESIAQVGLRGGRLGIALPSVSAVVVRSLDAVLAAAARHGPDVVVVDSIQTLESPSFQQPAGSVVQVRECAAALVRHAKETGMAVVLVGHVTKDGAVAGPRTLEHVVDAVVTLSGERTGSLRLLRTTKNRFGSCEETGVFTMTDRGLQAVADPSALLLADRRPGVAGSAVFCGMEGSRSVLVELQALVCTTKLVPPRRVAIGVDARRLSLILAVMAKAGVELGSHDVFVAAAGGLAVREPAADLALCLALCSAKSGLAIRPDITAIGEIGLAGEVRRVPAIERRLAEAARLGSTRALVPRNVDVARADIRQIAVEDLAGALNALKVERDRG